MPSTFAITSVALITIQSVNVVKDYLKHEIDALTAVSKVSRVTTATLLALGLSGAGMGLGAEIAQSIEMTEPILNTTLLYSASISGGIIGNMVGIYFNKIGWKGLIVLKDNIKHLIENVEKTEFNTNFVLAPVYATANKSFV